VSSAAGQAHARQVPHLLHLAAGLGDQLLPADAQMPQPRPGLTDRLGDIPIVNQHDLLATAHAQVARAQDD
jgi:hypothetical protein